MFCAALELDNEVQRFRQLQYNMGAWGFRFALLTSRRRFSVVTAGISVSKLVVVHQASEEPIITLQFGYDSHIRRLNCGGQPLPECTISIN